MKPYYRIARMRKRLAVMALLVVALVVVLSAQAQRRATQHAVTGIVAEFEAGHWLTVVSDQTGQAGLRFPLNPTTTYDSAFDPAVIKRGARVTVWYRSVGESRPVVDKVRLLEDAEPH